MRVPAPLLPVAALLLCARSQAARAVERHGEPGGLAGAVVRSAEYVVRRSPEKVEEFIGAVSYRQGDRGIRADWARFDHGSGLWEARGGVTASQRLESGETLRAHGHELRHDRRTGRGRMIGKRGEPISFLLLPPTPPDPARRGTHPPELPPRDRGRALAMEWDEPAGLLRWDGDVRLEGADGLALADTAEYKRPSGLLELGGRRPVLSRREQDWVGAVQADRISASRPDGRIEALGRVHGWLRFLADASGLEKLRGPRR